MLASARAGNVIVGGDRSENRLLPDAIRAWQAGATLAIRNPASVRPWQHGIEPLAGYLVPAQSLWSKPELAGPWNFGPNASENASVREVIEMTRSAWAEAEVAYGENAGPHEAGRLTLETAKARELLNVRPRWGLQEPVRRTVTWHRRLVERTSARPPGEEDIAAWECAR